MAQRTPIKPVVFPKGFFWGASTSSYQVEGGNHTQWTVWELSHAAELAQTAFTRYGWLPVWQSIKKEVTEPENYVSRKAVNHFELYKKDFKLLGELNLTAFRFGIEWARVEPEDGVWDEVAWKHYRDYIIELKKTGVEPFLNIWHWTVPVWFDEKGGFKKARNLAYFKRFVEKLGRELGKEIRYVLTINEPNTYIGRGYVDGTWPPQEKNIWNAAVVYYNLVRAHRIAYKALKKQKPSLQIGAATQLGNIQAKRKHSIVDRTTVRAMRYVWNWWFLNRIRRYQDFVGFNYYFTDYYQGFKPLNPKTPLNDMGWYMEPEGLFPLLICIKNRYKKPIIITENGVADREDKYRRWWIEESIVAMERAISEGADVRGYFHWSLLDNFEWGDGWWPKFGLVEVDRKTLKRTIRPSAEWYAQAIAERAHS